MKSVIQRIKEIKQPIGGYLNPKKFDVIELNDGVTLDEGTWFDSRWAYHQNEIEYNFETITYGDIIVKPVFAGINSCIIACIFNRLTKCQTNSCTLIRCKLVCPSVSSGSLCVNENRIFDLVILT